MAAVGLTDVYKYGARLLAHLLVVVLVGVVLVLTGDLIGEFLVGSVTDPSLRQPPARTGQVGWVGVGIAGIGVLATFIGLSGLLYKLVADGTAAGTRAVTGGKAGPVGASADVAGEERDAGPDEPRQSATASQADGTSQPDAATETPATDEQTAVSDATASDTGQTEPETEPMSAGTDEGETTQSSATAPEWTPPDPSEFEQPREEATSDESASTAEPFADDPAETYADDTKVVDEATIDDTGATSWEDLQTSAESGHPASESVETDSSTPTDWADETAEITDSAEFDRSSGEPDDSPETTEGPHDDSPETTAEPDDDSPETTAEPDDDDSEDGDAFESFEATETDPLSDALDDE